MEAIALRKVSLPVLSTNGDEAGSLPSLNKKIREESRREMGRELRTQRKPARRAWPTPGPS